jgi:flagellar protein FliL
MAQKSAAPPAASAGKPGRRKLMLALGAALLVLLLRGGTAVYFLVFAASAGTGHADDDAEERAGTAEADHAEAGTEEDRGAARFVDMPDLLVNLKGDGKRMRFLRLRLALEVGSERTAASVKALTPRVLDSFQMYLRSLTVEDVQGSVGMQRLKEEMIARVNVAIEPNRVRDVLFKEILVQ